MKKYLRNFVIVLPTLIIMVLIMKNVYRSYDAHKYQLDIQTEIAKIETPTEFSSGFKELTADNTLDLQEYVALDLQDLSTEVVAISESPSKNELMVILSNGFFYKWNIKSKTSLPRINIGLANKAGANFNNTGEWLLVPGEINPDKSLNGYQIIDTQAGDIIECQRAILCPGEIVEHNHGLLLSPNGQILITYNSDDGTLIPVLAWGAKLNFNAQIRLGDCSYNSNYDLDLQRISISPSQKYVAYIFETGEICVREFEEFSGINQNTGEELPSTDGQVRHFNRVRFDLRRDGEGRVRVYGFDFDPTNRFLAILTHREFTVFDLQKNNTTSSLFINTLVPDGTSIAFNRDGTVLALGTTNKILIYSMKNGSIISELKTHQTTSMYFTRDNRILISGDASGKLHLWIVE